MAIRLQRQRLRAVAPAMQRCRARPTAMRGQRRGRAEAAQADSRLSSLSSAALIRAEMVWSYARLTRRPPYTARNVSPAGLRCGFAVCAKLRRSFRDLLSIGRLLCARFAAAFDRRRRGRGMTGVRSDSSCTTSRLFGTIADAFVARPDAARAWRMRRPIADGLLAQDKALRELLVRLQTAAGAAQRSLQADRPGQGEKGRGAGRAP